MKKCSECGELQEPVGFHAKKASSDGLQSRCKKCVRAYSRDSYLGKKASMIAATMTRHERTRSIVQGLKTGPCADCKDTHHPFVMDFDHVRGEKILSVAKMAARCPTPAKIRAEIAKCDLVCANCHRVRTWNRNNPDNPIEV